MIEIYRKEGWMLNPNDKIVNTILKMCEKNGGGSALVRMMEKIKNVPALIIEKRIFVVVNFILELESKLDRISGLPAKQSVP